tara:strand:+ start:74 stop:715 length:642 start_codon:yes stop_codon:yes gene_type:complete
MKIIPDQGLRIGTDHKVRCFWPDDKKDYVLYHDKEWGTPLADDNLLFEKICLEGFQSGLSWLTVLRKRENLRKAFLNFNFEKLSGFSNKDVESLMKNKGIIRHRKKIESTINNARRASELSMEFGSLARFFWQYEATPEERPKRLTFKTFKILTNSKKSTRLAKDLKQRGWTYVGPVTMYSFMQSIGMVNDHIEGCFCRELTEEKRKHFKRPK